MPLTSFDGAKYLRWYDALMAKARSRQMPKINTETHHVRPRSLGGGDEESNLVRLTYREHFVAHWLLTKTCTGPDLRKMQFALFAMTMCANGSRVVSGWQYEVARRALYEPIQTIQARIEKQKRAIFDREIAIFREQFAALQSGSVQDRNNIGQIAAKLTKYHRFVRDGEPDMDVRVPDELVDDEPLRKRKRRPRRSKRLRMRAERAQQYAAVSG